MKANGRKSEILGFVEVANRIASIDLDSGNYHKRSIRFVIVSYPETGFKWEAIEIFFRPRSEEEFIELANCIESSAKDLLGDGITFAYFYQQFPRISIRAGDKSSGVPLEEISTMISEILAIR